MKKLCQILTAAGVILIIYSALALDSNTITTKTLYHNIIIAGALGAPQIIYNRITEE